jgi:hypothetical protein
MKTPAVTPKEVVDYFSFPESPKLDAKGIENFLRITFGEIHHDFDSILYIEEDNK